MEAHKVVKIGAQEQDVEDLSQVESNECPIVPKQITEHF
jgi:hypothetical protein